VLQPKRKPKPSVSKIESCIVVEIYTGTALLLSRKVTGVYSRSRNCGYSRVGIEKIAIRIVGE
jgi:hypothetical protein